MEAQKIRKLALLFPQPPSTRPPNITNLQFTRWFLDHSRNIVDHLRPLHRHPASCLPHSHPMESVSQLEMRKDHRQRTRSNIWWMPIKCQAFSTDGLVHYPDSETGVLVAIDGSLSRCKPPCWHHPID